MSTNIKITKKYKISGVTNPVSYIFELPACITVISDSIIEEGADYVILEVNFNFATEACFDNSIVIRVTDSQCPEDFVLNITFTEEDNNPCSTFAFIDAPSITQLVSGDDSIIIYQAQATNPLATWVWDVDLLYFDIISQSGDTITLQVKDLGSNADATITTGVTITTIENCVISDTTTFDYEVPTPGPDLVNVAICVGLTQVVDWFLPAQVVAGQTIDWSTFELQDPTLSSFPSIIIETDSVLGVKLQLPDDFPIVSPVTMNFTVKDSKGLTIDTTFTVQGLLCAVPRSDDSLDEDELFKCIRVDVDEELVGLYESNSPFGQQGQDVIYDGLPEGYSIEIITYPASISVTLYSNNQKIKVNTSVVVATEDLVVRFLDINGVYLTGDITIHLMPQTYLLQEVTLCKQNLSTNVLEEYTASTADLWTFEGFKSVETLSNYSQGTLKVDGGGAALYQPYTVLGIGEPVGTTTVDLCSSPTGVYTFYTETLSCIVGTLIVTLIDSEDNTAGTGATIIICNE